MNLKKYKIINIVTFVLALTMFAFGICKISIYASHRALYDVDYREIGNYISACVLFITLFILSIIYISKKKGKVAEIILYCLCFIVLIGYCKTYISQAIQVYTSDLWLPNPIDYFTSMFESIFGVLFLIFLISTFIYKIASKYYKRGENE